MKEMGFRISGNPGGHGELEHRLSNSKHIDIEKIGSQLGDLRSRRIQADYRLERREGETRKNAQAIVQQASTMIMVLDRCCAGPARPKVVEGIKEYLGKL